ncbi:MAG: hydrolase [Fibrobacterota bacterium]|jgi:8-oxo-dGTP diphosphatase
MPNETKSKTGRKDERDPVICTVDVVLLTLEAGSLRFVLVPREAGPFKGVSALPGGFVHPEEDRDLRACAERVLKVKAGVEGQWLEQLSVFSGKARDPRGWSLSVAWFAVVHSDTLRATLPAGAQLRDARDLSGLPFDHDEIVGAALSRLRSKSSYSSLPAHLCPETFTLPQLQAVYEAVMGEPINKVSFRRKMEELSFLEPVEGVRTHGGAHRPAQLWRLKEDFRIHLKLTDRGLNTGG